MFMNWQEETLTRAGWVPFPKEDCTPGFEFVDFFCVSSEKQQKPALYPPWE